MSEPRDTDGGKPTADGGVDKRDPKTGQLLPGHSLNKGKPMPDARRAALWRHSFTAAVTPEDITAVALELVKRARAGERWAVEQLLDRACGPARENITNILAIAADEGARKRVIIEALPPDDQRRHLSAFDDDPDIIDAPSVHRSPPPALTDGSSAASADTQGTCEQDQPNPANDCAPGCADQAPGSTTKGSGSVIEHSSRSGPETPLEASEREGWDEAGWTDISRDRPL